MNETTRSLLEANRLKNLMTDEAKIKDPRKDDFVMGMSVNRVEEETVTMEFIPSMLFGNSAKNIVDQVERIFRGNEHDSQPILVDDYDDTIELLTRYLETHLIIKMSYIHDEMRQTSNLIKNLRSENKKKYPVCPYMPAEAIALWGEVTWRNALVTITPVFPSTYDWQARLLTVEQYKQVRAWLLQLMPWGIQCVEDFNYSPEGDLEFMLMTFTEVNSLADVDDKKQARMRLRSDKPMANIKAVFRSFFINAKVQYITDRRLTIRYSDCETQSELLRYIEQNMTFDASTAKYKAVNMRSEGRVDKEPKPKAEMSNESIEVAISQ